MEQFFDVYDVHNWMVVLTVLAICLGIWHFQQLNDPRSLERTMGKRKERRDVADVLSAALQDAGVAGKITPAAAKKYNKKLALALGLADMISRKPFNERVALLMSRKRLTEMGVNIAAGLSKLRRSRPSKKDRLMAKVARKT